MSDIPSIVNDALSSNAKYVIFYSASCGYSQAALRLVTDKNKRVVVEISNKKDEVLSELRKKRLDVLQNDESINRLATHNTYPIIFHFNKTERLYEFVGGYTELEQTLSAGKNNQIGGGYGIEEQTILKPKHDGIVRYILTSSDFNLT